MLRYNGLEVRPAEGEMKEMCVTCGGTSKEMAYELERHRCIRENANQFSWNTVCGELGKGQVGSVREGDGKKSRCQITLSLVNRFRELRPYREGKIGQWRGLEQTFIIISVSFSFLFFLIIIIIIAIIIFWTLTMCQAILNPFMHYFFKFSPWSELSTINIPILRIKKHVRECT